MLFILWWVNLCGLLTLFLKPKRCWFRASEAANPSCLFLVSDSGSLPAANSRVGGSGSDPGTARLSLFTNNGCSNEAIGGERAFGTTSGCRGGSSSFEESAAAGKRGRRGNVLTHCGLRL
jgi:hypothetical protein